MKPTHSAENSSPAWALVTGASAGIGAEFCRQLAQRGYHIVLVARREQRMQELAANLRKDYPVETRVMTADLQQASAGESILARLQHENIQPQFLVNNAGIGLPGHFTDLNWQQHADFVQLMMTAVCDLTWRLLPAMQQNRKGYVVNVASLAGLIPGSAGHTLYGASKAFLIRFSESLAMENRQTGVNVSALCPGFTYSEFHDANGTRERVSQMPSWMWMDAEPVVRFGIDAVMSEPARVVAIPGRVNRNLARMARFLPEAILKRMIGRVGAKIRTRPAQQ